MSVKVMSWVWDHSHARGAQRLVLLAIADHANDDGLDAYPSLARLARKTGMTERGVHKAIQALVILGELVVTAGGGRGRSNRYRVLMTETRNLVHGSVGNPEPETMNQVPRTSFHEPETMNSGAVNPERRSTEPSLNHPKNKPSAPAVLPAVPAGTSVTQRSKRITDAYAAAEPMCRWPAINGVVIKAIKSGKFTDGEVHSALMRLAAEGRSVTVETLRVELAGIPPGNAVAVRSNGHRPSTTDQRFANAQALKAQFGGTQ